MEGVFEPVTENQKQNQTKQPELSEKQTQALRDSTQSTTQAIQHSSEFLNENLHKSIKENDEITIMMNLNSGYKNSNRYNIIKYLLQPQLGSGLNQHVFLPSDPDELVDQLKLIVLEKVGGNDNPMLSEQIVAIADKHLQYESITTNQHQNLVSAFTKKDQFLE